MLDLLSNRVPAGVDQAAYVKSGFLAAIAKGETECPLIDREAAVGGVLGRLPTVEEYMEYATKIDSVSDEIFRYMKFDQLSDYADAAERGREMVIEQLGDAA